MASGDSDHIEVMDNTVMKKSDVGTGLSSAEDDGMYKTITVKLMSEVQIVIVNFDLILRY